MKTFTPRTRTLIIAGIALLALLLVATSMGQIQFAPGSPLPFDHMEPELMPEETSDQFSRIMLAIMRVLMIAFWVLLPITLIMLILSKEARKQFFRYMMIVLPFILLLFIVTQRQGGEQQAETPEVGFASTPGLSGELTPVPPMPEFQPPAPWVTTVTTLVLAVGITAFILITVLVVWRRNREQSRPLARVRKEAQAALDAIQAGGDLRDVILRCYSQMVQAVGEHRNIRRSEDMTPHEFERILSSRGIPAVPVHDLTQIFEQVRYGAYRPGRQDERAAIASLAAIVSACERMKSE